MFTLEDIHALILAVRDAPIADLELEKGGWRIRISRGTGSQDPMPPPAGRPAATSGERARPEPPSSPAPEPERVILAPGYGVFHRSASPDDPPYAEIGQDIEKGQPVGIVEAMKVFSSITSPFSGRITDILVGNGEDVEAGQPLFRLQ